MPLGASRVDANRPYFESYRYELWKLLISSELEFDYVGTQNDNSDYPMYFGETFDVDHEGRGGWTAEGILSEINNWLDNTDIPDIVLFSAPGGNDALGGVDYNTIISNVNSIIDILQERNPNITIIIERPAPVHSSLMTGYINDYFIQLENDIEDLCLNQTTSSSQVTYVDMFTDFIDDYLADDLHYNQDGAKFIANKYYEVLIEILQ
jgi:lysophospholipase L1-like esterase